MPDFIRAWATAIAQYEGFNSLGSVATRNHNPGNLKFAGQAGAVGKDSRGFAIFQDDSTGWQALYNQLAKYVRTFPGYSILQITAHYLGQSTPTVDAEGNAFNYANFVAGQLGVAVTTTLAYLTGQVSSDQVSSDQIPSNQMPADQVSTDQLPADQVEISSQDGSSSGGSNVLLVVIGLALFLMWQRSLG